ncbi:MAG: hypothetical protein ABIQ57_03510 [Candidatus Kapaibacterium sp.]
MMWSHVKHCFDWDGSLRDIYITPATLDDWRVAYRLFRSMEGTKFYVGHEPSEFPDDVSEIFVIRAECSPMLYVKMGSVTFVFHFFTEKEIECDIDSRSVQSQSDLDALLAFMKMMGDAIGKQVILTAENCREIVMIRYEPGDGNFSYMDDV